MRPFTLLVSFKGAVHTVQLPGRHDDTSTPQALHSRAQDDDTGTRSAEQQDQSRHEQSQTYDPSLQELGRAVADAVGAAYGTVKLLAPGVRTPVVPSTAGPHDTCSSAGLKDGSRVLLMASAAADVAAVQSARDLPGLVDFDQELLRAARRRRAGGGGAGVAGRSVLTPPSGEFSFGSYRAWEEPGLKLTPPPGEALQLLYRLAADPGIVAVMTRHRYKVGVLSEMPPEGKVGISPVCVLGLNINAGQEIQLRLRTDDLKGFRKYERIRDTLVHELAHMEYGEHDNDFKELNSLLLRECEAAARAHAPSPTRMLLSAADAAGVTAGAFRAMPSQLGQAWSNGGQRSELDEVVDPQDVMAATARMSGRTLRQLARGGPPAPATPPATSMPRSPAPAQQQPSQVAANGPGGLAAVPSRAGTKGQPGADTSGSSGGDGDGEGREGGAAGDRGAVQEPQEEDDIATRYEHFDPGTEAAEAAMARLGSLDEPPPPAAPGHAGPRPSNPGPSGPDPNGPAPGASSAPGHATGPSDPGPSDPGQGPGSSTAAPARAQHGAMATSSGAAIDVPTDMDVDGPVEVLGQHGQAMQVAALTAGAAGPADSADLSPAAQQPLAATPSPSPPTPQSPDARASAPSAAGPTPAPSAPSSTTAAPTPPKRVRLGPLPALFAYESVSGNDIASAGNAAGGASGDDVAVQKLSAVWAALGRLVAALGGEAGACGQALATLRTLLANVVQHPQEERYQQVRLSNAALQRRLGPAMDPAKEVLVAAGFAVQQRPVSAGAPGNAAGVLSLAQQAQHPGSWQAQPAEDVMVWARRDPGLVWLALSALGAAEEAVAAAMAAS